MVNLFRRIRNIWKLSEYRMSVPEQKWVKNVATIEKKLATIIPEEKKDIFEEEIKDD